jgi:NADP-dependent 3-hydroxy acid dehydrogenase YdfG
MARMRRVNVDGVIHTIRAVAPGMQERGYGRIVNIASNAAIGTALPATTFYAATGVPKEGRRSGWLIAGIRVRQR